MAYRYEVREKESVIVMRGGYRARRFGCLPDSRARIYTVYSNVRRRRRVYTICQNAK